MTPPKEDSCAEQENTVFRNGVCFSEGMTFNGYHIEKELGAGGTGRVFLVRVPGNNNRFALKLISPELTPDQKTRELFLNSVQKLKGFVHPNFISITDAGCSDGICYLLMDYLPGKTLKEVLEEEQELPFDSIFLWIREAASAMEALWRDRGIIHGDIKPDNMLLDSEGHLHLADAAVLRDFPGNEIMGTPQYIAPERLTGKTADIRSDLYSLGIAFYQLTARKLPFAGNSTHEVLKKQLTEAPVSPRFSNQALPGDAEKIILKLMEKNPSLRFQTPEELHLAMEQLLSPRKKGDSSRETTALYIMESESEQSKEVERMRSEHESGNRRLFYGLVLGVALIMVLTFAGIWGIVFLPMESENSLDRRLAELRRSRPLSPKKDEPVQVRKESPYVLRVKAVFEEAALHPTETTRILNSCDRFFRKFPKAETPEEKRSFEQLLDLFTPLDEMRCENARKALSHYQKQPSADGQQKIRTMEN